MLTLGDDSELNIEILLEKHVMKKIIFLASIYIGKFNNLVKNFYKFERIKNQTIVFQQKFYHFSFNEKEWPKQRLCHPKMADYKAWLYDVKG